MAWSSKKNNRSRRARHSLDGGDLTIDEILEVVGNGNSNLANGRNDLESIASDDSLLNSFDRAASEPWSENLEFRPQINNIRKSQELIYDKLPCLALVNGLSGGRKGEKVMKIFKRYQIPAFNLLSLAKNEKYFDAFCQSLKFLYKR